MDQEPRCKPETMKLLEENIEEVLQNINTSKNFMDMKKHKQQKQK
jgi:hypothetical protein